MVGIVRSDKTPDEDHAYGYMAERYIWALISAVGIFFLGCGVSMYHGIETLIHHMTTHGEEAHKMEQACVGVVIALVAIIIYQFTGNPYIDPIASILIGLLLGFVAMWLVWRNSSLLIGTSVPAHIRSQVEKIIHENPAVEEIVDMKTRIMDTETYRIKADLRFDGEALADKLSEKLPAAYEKIKNYDQFRDFAREFADDVVELLADEIDSIEKKIQEQVPQARHMDFEAD